MAQILTWKKRSPHKAMSTGSSAKSGSLVLIQNSQDYNIARRRMVEDHLQGRGITDLRVLQAFLKLPRQHFVEEALASQAYSDYPLNIGDNQTLSQPYIVAYMLEKLRLSPSERVLEIGTGSGYQTALLAEMVREVYSVERLPALMFRARKVLKALRYSNISLRLGDGTQGWSKHAPYDAIVVAAAGPEIPEPYLEQLAEGGRLILPCGTETDQELIFIEKQNGEFKKQVLSACRFVKLKGRYGFAVS